MLLEVPDSKVVSVGHQKLDPSLLHFLFQLIHQFCSEALNLLICRNSKERDLRKLLLLVNPEAYSSDDLLADFPDHNGLVFSVKNELANVFFGHFGELHGEDVFEVY